VDDDEIVLALPDPVLPLRHLRSTLLLGSMASLKAAGHWEAYVRAIAPEALAALESAVAGMWLPLELARAHYAACDALKLSAESAVQMGRSTLAQTKTLLLGTALAIAKGGGVTPWTLLPHVQRFWQRGCDGGAMKVDRKGPKEAHVILVGCPLVASPYFRHGLRGLTGGIFELVCERVYVSERTLGKSETSVLYRMQWV
jgi:hypothetical protein